MCFSSFSLSPSVDAAACRAFRDTGIRNHSQVRSPRHRGPAGAGGKLSVGGGSGGGMSPPVPPGSSSPHSLFTPPSHTAVAPKSCCGPVCGVSSIPALREQVSLPLKVYRVSRVSPGVTHPNCFRLLRVRRWLGPSYAGPSSSLLYRPLQKSRYYYPRFRVGSPTPASACVKGHY